MIANVSIDQTTITLAQNNENHIQLIATNYRKQYTRSLNKITAPIDKTIEKHTRKRERIRYTRTARCLPCEKPGRRGPTCRRERSRPLRQVLVEAAQVSPSGGGRGEGRVRVGFSESYSLGVGGLGFVRPIYIFPLMGHSAHFLRWRRLVSPKSKVRTPPRHGGV